MSDAYAEIVELIYGAVEPEAPIPWTEVLQRAAHHVGVDAIGFAFHSQLERGEPPFAYGIEEPSTLAYPHFHGEDRVWSHAVCGQKVGRVREVLPADLLERSSVYQEWVRPQKWVQTYHLTICEETRGALLIGRRRSGTRLDRRGFAFLEEVAPHVRRTIRLRAKLTFARDLVQATDEAINSLRLGFLVLDRRGRVVFINEAAQRMMGSNGLSIRSGRFRLHCAKSQEQLEAGLIRRKPVILRLPRPGMRDLQFVAVPLDRVGADGSTERGAAVLLSDPDKPLQLSRGPLEILYGLTPAQATLAALLAEGHAPEDCARILGRTVGTIRDRLKQVLARTGTRRQSELVALLLRNAVTIPEGGGDSRG